MESFSSFLICYPDASRSSFSLLFPASDALRRGRSLPFSESAYSLQEEIPPASPCQFPPLIFLMSSNAFAFSSSHLPLQAKPVRPSPLPCSPPPSSVSTQLGRSPHFSHSPSITASTARVLSLSQSVTHFPSELDNPVSAIQHHHGYRFFPQPLLDDFLPTPITRHRRPCISRSQGLSSEILYVSRTYSSPSPFAERTLMPHQSNQ